MIFTNTITLILALAPAALLAAPTQTFDSVAELMAKRHLPVEALAQLKENTCDLRGLTMPAAQPPLPAPGAGLKLAHVAIGRGVQNYTCATASAQEVPKPVGAIASLYNATCGAVRAPKVLADVTALAIKYPVPESEIAKHMLSGHHEFTELGVPLFKLQTPLNDYGYVQAKKNASSDAPNPKANVAWLKLTATEGDYQEVYRLNTAGGVPPKTCEGAAPAFSVIYAAEYYFWK